MLRSVSVMQSHRYCQIHANTVKQLELLESSDYSKTFSLFGTLNRCQTAMGARCLRQWCIQPLFDQIEIENRLDVVSLFVDDFLKKESLRSQLGTLNDLERSAARLVGLNRNPKELRTLASSIKAVFSLSAHLEGLSTCLLYTSPSPRD